MGWREDYEKETGRKLSVEPDSPPDGVSPDNQIWQDFKASKPVEQPLPEGVSADNKLYQDYLATRKDPEIIPKEESSGGFLDMLKNTFSNAMKPIEKGPSLFDFATEALSKTKLIRGAAEAYDQQDKGKINLGTLANFGPDFLEWTKDPVLKSLNTQTGEDITSAIYNSTSNVPIKIFARFKAIGDKTYKEAYDEMLKDRYDPNNGQLLKILYGVQDSGVQSAIIALLAAGASAWSKNPNVGRAIAAPLFTAISAEGQRKEKGKVDSKVDLAIDTIGDTLISDLAEHALKSVVKESGKTLVKQLLVNSAKGFGVEGFTEPTQTFFKYANDYIQAKTPEEKKIITEKVADYVKNGGLLEEFLVGGISGALIGGGATALGNVINKPEISKETEPNLIPEAPKVDGEKKKEVYEKTYDEYSGGVYDPNSAVFHKDEVLQAIQDGKKVPDEVINSINNPTWRAEIEAKLGNVIPQLQQKLREAYSSAGESSVPGFSKANEVLSNIATELEVAKPGERIQVNGENIGISSTFPDWIPENLRRTDLIKKFLAIFDESKLEYPPANQPRLRKFYDAILDEADDRLGINTKDIRNNLIKEYGKEKKGGVTKAGDRGVRGTSRTGTGTRAESLDEYIRQRTDYNGPIERGNSIVQDYLDGFRGKNNKFEERTGIPPKLIGAQAAFSNNKIYDMNWRLENGMTVQEFLAEKYRNEGKTQEQKVKESVKEAPKTIKEIAEETKIKEPNIRRILGVGAKEGTFERVDKGVYVLSKDGQDMAWVETGNAVESLPRLAKEGFKADMVFLDIPYDTPAVKGGNRGVKYDLLSVSDFGKVLDAVNKIVKTENSPIIHMYSQAASGMKAMQKYNDLILEKGFIPVGKGEYQKTFADGSPVTSPNGKVSKPEGILVFTKSGELDSDLENLNFTLRRPQGYQTEKPAEMLKAMIEMTTKEGDVVLDPFAGSGVTGAEAVRAGRKAYLIERNPEVAENITKPRVKEAISENKPKGTSDLASLASPQGQKTIRKILERQNKADVSDVETVPKAFKISERAKQILEEFDVPVSEKSISSRFLGLYKHATEKVRVQSLYDISTVTHEAIHAIDAKINFSENLIKDTGRGAPIRKQLTDIYEALYPNAKRTHKLEKRIKEGLAVFFENYFYNPSEIISKYPQLVDNFIKTDGKYYNPLFTKLLDRMNELVDDYAKLSPEERIASRIRTGKEVVDRQSGFTWKQRAVFELANKFEPLKRYAKKAGVSETWDDPMVQAFNIMNKNSIVSNWVKGKSTPILMRDGNFRIEKGTVKDYLELVKGKEKEFKTYLVARRVFEMNNQINALKNEKNKLEISDPAIDEQINKLESIVSKDDFSSQDAAAVVSKYSEQFTEAEKIYDDINKKLIDVAEEGDLISSDTADTYRAERGYASFRRFIDDDITSVGTLQSSSKSKVSGFKERTGSQLDIIDPVYSQILAINEIMGKAMENRLWSKVANVANKNVEIARRFERIEPKTSVDADGNISFPQEKDPNIIRVFNKGKREFYKAAPEFIAVSKTLRPKEFDLFSQILTVPSSVFSRLTTSANPIFAASNITIDQFTATAQTKTGYKPIVDPIKSFVDMIKGEEGVELYKAIGGKRQTLAAMFDLSPEDVTSRLTGGETTYEKAKGIIDSGLNILELPSNTSEIMTRYAEFKRSIEAGEPESVAMYRASEVTVPFQLSGNFGGRFGQVGVKSIPYLNAVIQVLYKFGRASKDNPKRVATVLATLFAAGLTSAISLMSSGSDEQKRLLGEQPARNLSRYIYIPAPNGKDLIKIRIPEQFGAFTGMAYLYVIKHYGGNEAAFKDYLDAISSAVPEQVQLWDPKGMVLSYIPQTFKPSVMVAANTKVFPEVGPIVPQYVVDKAPKEQYNTYTSKVSKAIADMMGLSPILTDYWIKNQFGAVGSMLVGSVPNNPIYIQEGEYVMSGRSYNRFYDNKELVTQQYDEVLKNNPDKYTGKEKEEITIVKKTYDKMSDVLSDMRKISTNHELPNEVRAKAYNILLNIDSTEKIDDVRYEIGDLKNDVDDLRREYGIK